MSHSTVTACIIIIGNEILSGRTHDKNLPYIAEKLNEVGVRVMQAMVIPDIEDVIVETIQRVSPAFDYIFTTGGIGPTHDDITTAAIAKALGLPVVRNPEAEVALHAYYGEDRINEARLSMADVPQGASLIPNPVSIAPGFIIENIHVMAGVPSICRVMIDHIAPLLRGGSPMHSIALDVDVAEGDIADSVTEVQTRFATVEIGIYPRFAQGKLSSHIVLRAQDQAALEHAHTALTAAIKPWTA